MIRFKELIVTSGSEFGCVVFECMGFYIVVNSFETDSLVHINILQQLIYGFATIAGAVTMLGRSCN
jgi:hypothetical protein